MRGLVLVAALGAMASPASAGSQVIHVAGPDAPGAEAALGRGYSTAGHTFLVNCFATVAASRPSYDVRYHFEATDGDGDGDGAGEADRHQVRIVLSFHVYNRSLDEAASVLAPEALGLIERGDLVGFFDACGTSFTRSITRTGVFESVLTYQSDSGGRDHGFEQDLEVWIKGWGRRGGGAGAPPAGAELSRRATRNRLAVRSTATGFGKRAGADLVADDLESFRAAAQAAFRSMQADDVGEIDQIEVVPWSDHPQVRQLLGAPRGERRTLIENSELVSELGRVIETRRLRAQLAEWHGAPAEEPAARLPSAAEACAHALLAGDTLRQRPHRDLPACRGIEMVVAAEEDDR